MNIDMNDKIYLSLKVTMGTQSGCLYSDLNGRKGSVRNFTYSMHGNVQSMRMLKNASPFLNVVQSVI